MKFLAYIQRFLDQRKHPMDLAVARILFFSVFLYRMYNWTNPLGWLKTNWQSHWIPISFFKFIPLEFVTIENFKILYLMMIASAFCALIGFLTRAAIVICFISTLIYLGLPLNFGKLHHSNHMIIMTLFFLSFTKNHLISLDFLLKKYFINKNYFKLKLFDSRPWAVYGLILYMSFAYFESGYQKLKNSGWRWFHPDNLSLILLTRPSITELGRWAAEQSWLMFLLALMTWLIEFFAPLSLFHKKLMYFFGFSLFCFHFGTLFLMGGHGDFRNYSLCFVFWAPWYGLSQYISKALISKPT